MFGHTVHPSTKAAIIIIILIKMYTYYSPLLWDISGT